MITSSQQRLQEPQLRFIELEGKLSNTPEKDAISILYAIMQESWCASSQMVRRSLDRLSVPYIYRDMERDMDAARQVQWWTGGSFSHPTVQIGGQILVEPSLNELDQALKRVGMI